MRPPRLRPQPHPCKQCGADTSRQKRLCDNCRQANRRQREDDWNKRRRKQFVNRTKNLSERICSKCRVTKPASDFRLFSRRNDRGYQYTYLDNVCRQCRLPTGRTYVEKRRSRKERLPNALTLAEWQATIAHFDNRCVYCGQEADLHQDHFIPLSKGGPYTKDNIVPACAQCNGSKRDQLPLDWLVKRDGGLVRYVEIVCYLGI